MRCMLSLDACLKGFAHSSQFSCWSETQHRRNVAVQTFDLVVRLCVARPGECFRETQDIEHTLVQFSLKNGALLKNTSFGAPYLKTQCDSNSSETSRPVMRFT